MAYKKTHPLGYKAYKFPLYLSFPLCLYTHKNKSTNSILRELWNTPLWDHKSTRHNWEVIHESWLRSHTVIHDWEAIHKIITIKSQHAMTQKSYTKNTTMNWNTKSHSWKSEGRQLITSMYQCKNIFGSARRNRYFKSMRRGKRGYYPRT